MTYQEEIDEAFEIAKDVAEKCGVTDAELREALEETWERVHNNNFKAVLSRCYSDKKRLLGGDLSDVLDRLSKELENVELNLSRANGKYEVTFGSYLYHIANKISDKREED